MDSKQFREFGKAAVDFIADYIESVEDRPVKSVVSPGYTKHLIPEEAPEKGETWQEVLKDMERVVVPGITPWTSPRFHAYYPTAFSFPAVVGELMSAGFGSLGLSWISSPIYTELEVTMMNWLGRLLGLPEEFLNSSEGPGGGCIQGSASETTLIALLTAKEKKVKEIMEQDNSLTESAIKGRLVAYSSDQSNSSVEKAGLLGSMTMRLLPTDENGKLRGEVLEAAIKEDKRRGLIPCYLVANLGTTLICSFDDLEELGLVCSREKLWMHVDAAYAGSSFACPEYRYLMKGVELADSFNFNAHKWMLVNFDCSAMWVRDASHLVEAFNVQRIYLKDEHQGLAPEYRHWQISLGRRFRSLKLWFVLRIYGVEGIRAHIRKQIGLAEYFKELVEKDRRFEMCICRMGLLLFRLKGEDALTAKLLEEVERRGRLFVMKGQFGGKLMMRIAICSAFMERRNVEESWTEIRSVADGIVGVMGEDQKGKPGIEIENTRSGKVNIM